MTLKVGAHVSISSSRASNDPETPPYGNIANAVFRQKQFGGNCGQIFTHSPQVWQDPDIGDEEAEQFREGTKAELAGPWVIHTSYLVNLCTPKEGLREKSLDSMQKEVDAAAALDIPYVNVHLGAHTGAGVEGGLDNAASVIDDIDVPDGVTILIESDAGAGTKLGGEFEHLAGVIDRTETDIDVCVDTAHAFAAGYDLSTADAVDQTIGEFDDVVGLEHLKYIHLNDSKHGCGTNKDEHAHIGEGHIGEAGMERIINHPDLVDVPLALETPTENGKSFAWNIDRVRDLRAE
ncbi:apurinic endonuclease Apn1 [Halorubrum aidingense JCM 13560]|uniref:Probable endonuclease 4 n=1 Tax=Halorubrum aidingense JCM 13560 TaxID=1230454 RepID=M0PIF9_9EURY|nr:deoxyribonuclease IV [Halorubrum aidingense]EMA69832.1 apurinic endonuclease Apn1 [Halorubrum aidingense JCM 13560]